MKTLLFVYFALVILTLSACQKSSKEALVSGQNGQCMSNPASCYNQGNGFSQYGGGGAYGYSNSASLCNCPPGTMPAYNGYNGLGCVNRGLSGFSGYLYLSWGRGQWSQSPYINNYGGGCYGGAVGSCTAGLSNSCPSGYFCKATNPASSLGLCVTTYR